MNLTSETKLFLGIIVLSLILVVGGVFFFSRPAQPVIPESREELVSPDAHFKGNASASAYLVEFSDFQCPACETAHPYANAVSDKYKDNLLFVYRHFPLAQHPFAEKAAIAAEAAGRQGKFWEAHDYLFDHQTEFSDEFLAGLAKELGLDEEQYSKDRENPELAAKVQEDITAANRLGINSTPTFYLNGVKLNLTSFTELDERVGAAIRETGPQ